MLRFANAMPKPTRTPSPQITENLKAALRDSGMTQAMLAHLTGVSVRAVQKWLDGSAQPTTTKLIAAAEVFGRNPAWFYVDHSRTEEAA